MSIKEILELDPSDVMKLNRKDLAKLVSTLNSAANKRLKRALKRNRERGEGLPPSIEALRDENGIPLFSVKGLNQNQLRNAYKRVRAFLNAKTSTAKGYEAFKKKEREAFNIPKNLSARRRRMLYRALDRLKKNNRALMERINMDSNQLRELLFTSMQDKGWKNQRDPIKEINDKLDELDKKRMEEIDKYATETEDSFSLPNEF